MKYMVSLFLAFVLMNVANLFTGLAQGGKTHGDQQLYIGLKQILAVVGALLASIG